MAKIRIDIDALLANSSVISTKIGELENLNIRLDDLISRIGASWEGDSSIAYINKMRGHSSKAKKMIEVLAEYKKYVDSAASKFNAVDRNSAAKIRSSF